MKARADGGMDRHSSVFFSLNSSRAMWKLRATSNMTQASSWTRPTSQLIMCTEQFEDREHYLRRKTCFFLLLFSAQRHDLPSVWTAVLSLSNYFSCQFISRTLFLLLNYSKHELISMQLLLSSAGYFKNVFLELCIHRWVKCFNKFLPEFSSCTMPPEPRGFTTISTSQSALNYYFAACNSHKC